MSNSNDHSVVYLCGQFITEDKAFISPEDRGYYFADGVYEVIKYYRGHPFLFEDHMIRLRNSLAGVRIDFDDFSEISRICNGLIDANGLETENAGVYIQITRGAAPRIHRFPGNDVKPVIYARSFPMPTNLDELEKGISVITREDIRWLRCNIKSISLLPNTLLFQEAVEQNAGECFLIRNGKYTEATHSNIMAVMKGTVYTHPDSNLILPGITKKAVIRLSMELGIQIIERPIAAEETPDFEECFITGTGSEIMPVIIIDGKTVGNGLPGPLTRQLQNALFQITYKDLGGQDLSLQSTNHQINTSSND